MCYERLSFKDDTAFDRRIRVIPRTSNYKQEITLTSREAVDQVKSKFGVGGSARIPMPTIYLSISRVYPLGEKRIVLRLPKLKRPIDCIK